MTCIEGQGRNALLVCMLVLLIKVLNLKVLVPFLSLMPHAWPDTECTEALPGSFHVPVGEGLQR